mmetsp:Transcript_56254/g.132565  ORF Transcript_56254/g.132565 Transcript_56254/m.132565 type:complete len:256 (-) Transcript_56254:163-930(-)
MGNEQSSNLACCSCSDSKAWRGADMEDFRPMFKNKKLGILAEGQAEEKKAVKEKSAQRKGDEDTTSNRRKKGEDPEANSKGVTKWTSYARIRDAENEKPESKRLSAPEKYTTIKYAEQPWKQEWELVEQLQQEKLEKGAKVAGSSPPAVLPQPPGEKDEAKDAFNDKDVLKARGTTTPRARNASGSLSARSFGGSAKEIKGVLRTPRDGNMTSKTPRSARDDRGQSADAEETWTPNRASVRFVKEAQIVTKSRRS